MHIENALFSNRLDPSASWDGDVFQFCTFLSLEEEGVHVTSSFIDSKFEGCEFYLALFNSATLVGVTFKNCRFKGCGFPGSRLVECNFEDCSFTADNLGGECRLAGSHWHGCRQRGTVGLNTDLAAT